MADSNTDLKHVATHVPASQKAAWKEEADEMGASMSDYVQMMTSAGRKKFDRQVEPDKSRAELRQELADVLQEVEEKHEKVQSLRRQLRDSEKGTVIEYVSENPGAEYGDIQQHLLNSLQGRLTTLLSEMEGAELRRDEDGKFYAGDNAGVEVSRD